MFYKKTHSKILINCIKFKIKKHQKNLKQKKIKIEILLLIKKLSIFILLILNYILQILIENQKR